MFLHFAIEFLLLLSLPSLLLTHPCSVRAAVLALSAPALGTHASCEQAHGLLLSANAALQPFDLVFFFSLQAVAVGKAHDR